jgi:hypothetical protein
MPAAIGPHGNILTKVRNGGDPKLRRSTPQRGVPTLAICLLLAGISGCATRQGANSPERAFDFQHDTFAFANQLKWEYGFDDQGHWNSRRRQPPPTYYQHCFVVARSARQFFLNARFEPALPRVTAKDYIALIRRVAHSSPREPARDADKIVIPGYTDLKAFSADNENLLKAECGGAWRSYAQRGHWRMLFPFSRANQAEAARRLADELRDNQPRVVHIVRFPQLTINHAVVFFDARAEPDRICFSIYDPNNPAKPREIIYDREKRTCFFAANDYFPGGRVDVYEIYKGWRY